MKKRLLILSHDNKIGDAIVVTGLFKQLHIGDRKRGTMNKSCEETHRAFVERIGACISNIEKRNHLSVNHDGEVGKRLDALVADNGLNIGSQDAEFKI